MSAATRGNQAFGTMDNPRHIERPNKYSMENGELDNTRHGTITSRVKTKCTILGGQPVGYDMSLGREGGGGGRNEDYGG